MPVTDDLRQIYDTYFASNDYDNRYPHPNLSTLQCLRRHEVAQARHVLDLGCGSGRYALPVLTGSQAHLTACDPSAAALVALRERIKGYPDLSKRVTMVEGDVHALDGSRRFDFIMMLFGVLGHIDQAKSREAVLRKLLQLARADCTLVLSVPNIWRRRPLETLQSAWKHWRDGGDGDWHDIGFVRHINGQNMRFFYHLYTLSEIRDALTRAGWRIVTIEAESITPEWWITPRPWLNRLEAKMTRAWPAVLGYGLRVVAQPEGA
jgi:SAM-dependent methyltransferase